MYNWAANAAGGAVEGRDGFNQIGLLIALGGLHLPNAEGYERIYPAMIRRQEFRTDAAGAGTFRGGSGVHYAVDVTGDATYSFRGEGLDTPSGFGIQGGGTGSAGTMHVQSADGTTFTAPKYGVREFPPARLEASSPAGGGWGDPKQRDPALVLRDVRDEIVSTEGAREVYGVVITGDGRSVDMEATRALRG